MIFFFFWFVETVFKYSNPLYSVEQVNKTQFDSCYSDSNPIKTYDSGHDRVPIAKGTTYFICGVPDYCGYGMRIVINAAAWEPWMSYQI